MSDDPKPEYFVRACRGHFHVVGGTPENEGEDIALPGDPFKTREDALAAMDAMLERDARGELESMRYAAAHSFFTLENSLMPNPLRCPHCGAEMNATTAPPLP